MNFLDSKSFLEQAHLRHAHDQVFLSSEVIGNKDIETGSAHPKIAFRLIENDWHRFTWCISCF